MSDKDYSLLRPFDLEAAKRGDEFVFISPGTGEQKTRKLVAEKNGHLVVDYGDTFQITTIDFAADGYRMAPLCWVEGRPVYKWDVLWHTARGAEVIADKVSSHGSLIEPACTAGDYLSNLTWTPPKVKREGYTLVQKASVHENKADAESFLRLLGEPDRWVVCAVEWEEQP